jgi:hypothetical protein
MGLTAREREFLEALNQDKLPPFDSLGALHRVVNPLLRQGLVDASPQAGWTRYSLTQAGRDRLAGEQPRSVNPFDRSAPTLAQQTQYMVDAVNNPVPRSAAPASLADAARAALPALVLLGDFIGNTFEGKTGIPAFDRCRIILDLKRALGELPDGTAS